MSAYVRTTWATVCMTLAIGAWAGPAAAQVCTSEAFNYPDGPIDGNGGWTVSVQDNTGQPPADPTEIAIEGGTVKIKAPAIGTTSIIRADLDVDCAPCEDGIITVSFKILGDPTGNNGTLWGVYFDDPSGVNRARFFRGSMGVSGRTGGLALGYLTDLGGAINPLNGTTYDELKAVIDMKNNLTTYYINDVLMTVQDPASVGLPAGSFVNPISTGVDAANSQTPQSQAIGRIRLERQASATSTGTITIDDIQITSCPGTCSARVTPTEAQTAYATAAGEAATPASVALTVTNDNVDSLSYTVAETLANGTPHDYPWLSLDKSAGGPLNTTQSDVVTASFNTTGLADGEHIAYVTVTDGCVPAKTYTRAIKLFVGDCLTENFDFSDAGLEKTPGWTGPQISSLSITPVRLEGGAVRLIGDIWTPAASSSTHSPAYTHVVSDACPACSVNGGLFSVKIKAKGGLGIANIWRLFIEDAEGVQIASWAGTGTTVRGRMDNPAPNPTLVTDDVTLSTTQYSVLEARINTGDAPVGGVPANSTLFLVDGVPIPATGQDVFFNPMPHLTGAADAIGQIRLQRLDRRANGSDAQGHFILFDDLSVGRCTEQCNDPAFDVRDTTNATTADGLVTVHDFNVFQTQCATGPTPDAGVFDALSFECRCMDVDGNLAVDMNDFGRFQRCYTGPEGGPVDPSCDD